jgi:Flp pilus assembly pilin Flp
VDSLVVVEAVVEEEVVDLANSIFRNQKGQAILEYSLIITVFVLVAIVAFSSLEGHIVLVINKVNSYLTHPPTTNIEIPNNQVETPPTPTPPLTPLGSTLPEISGNMIDKINAYYLANGKYPSGNGEKAYTDLGLDPATWKNVAYNGVEYNPGGDKVTIYPATGFTFSIKDKNGETIEISKNNWGLVYSIPNSKTWHYRKANGVVVDIDTLEISKNSP